MAKPKILLVGWDAADWKVIRPLMEAGKMPNIARLVAAGCSSSIATLQPSYSPMLWTSIATGKRPFNHGIHGFSEPRPDGRGIQRVTNLARTTKAIWNILGQNGLHSIVVGWWPSYPAEPIRGAMVSDSFHRIAPDFKLVPGLVHPPEFAEPLAALRLNPEDLPADLLSFFVPRVLEIDSEHDRRLRSAARIIAECANIHTTATWLMDREPWDLCAVYFDAIDHFGHGFMKYNPPHRSAVDEKEFALYQGVLQAGYQLHDRMLGTLLQKAGDDTTVILLSDHGFHPDHLRPTAIPEFHAGPAVEHRNNGIFVIAGPNIRNVPNLSSVTLLDIAPTILTLFGLPVGDDMDGGTLTGAFRTPPAIRRIPSWDRVEGEDGRHPPHMKFDPVASTESLEQLVALGYVEEPDADHEKAARKTLVELRTNLAEAYQDADRHIEASAILHELRESDPDDQRVVLRLFVSMRALRQTAAMTAIASDWTGRRRDLYNRSLTRLNELRDLARRIAAEPGRDESEPLLDSDQRAELRNLRRVCRYDPALATYFQAQVYCARRRWQDAMECLDRIPTTDLIRPGLFTDRSHLLGKLNRWSEVSLVLTEALASDPTDARVHFGRSRLLLHNRDYAAAAHSALDGLALLERNPAGHYLLGIALTRLTLYDQAVSALTRALAVNPNFPQAHLWLARIYRRWVKNPDKASAHSQVRMCSLAKNLQLQTAKITRLPTNPAPRPIAFAATARELPPLGSEVVIVCGLPRSGTSMLMQMLVAGGLSALTDGLRSPDEDNPRGYFEFEPVKQMADGAPWIEQAQGKVIKIVAPLIQNLPDGVSCRVLLTERDINDIVASQHQMMIRRGRAVDETPARLNRLKDEYLRLVIWTKGFLAGRAGTHLMCLDRNAIIRDPQGAAEAINRFLGGNLDVARMAAEVKPELNRQQSALGTHKH